MSVPKLLMVAPGPVIELPGDKVVLDVKFLDGLKAHLDFWPGEMDCVLRKGATHIAFERTVARTELPVGLSVLEADGQLTADMVRSYDIVLASGDSRLDWNIEELISGTGTKLVYAIEYTLETRLRIIQLERTRSLPRKLYSGLWTLRQERLRRAAFRRAHGLQANGYPVYQAYDAA
jgi:colanic acid/amylovoran biosynthesis glycosyltransferase